MESVKLSGYAPTKEFAAQQITRGGKTVYIISLPLALVPIHLQVPDPSRPIEENRAVNRSHATKFGEYWLSFSDKWTVPPLLVDTSRNLVFRAEFTIKDGPRMGILEIPDYSSDFLRTLDGQHRILGFDIIRKRLLKEQELAQEQFNNATRAEDPLLRDVAKQQLEKARNQISRLENEQVTIEIITGVSDEEHKKFFITIADNALGINASERARMDDSLTARVARILIEDVPLLKNRVEERKASAGKKYLLSLANVRDIVSHLCVGISGRVTLARESQIDQKAILDISLKFFQAMTDNIKSLSLIVNGEYLPINLKAESLIASPTIWRGLAGAYFELAVTFNKDSGLHWNRLGHEQFINLLPSLVKRMRIENSPEGKIIEKEWYGTELFPAGSLAPGSRAQDLRALVDLFTAWAKSGKPFDPQKLPIKNLKQVN
jgi:ferredoxin-fold anticodon binding domain-containing protein